VHFNGYKNKSVLICGNGPSLPRQLATVDLSAFDYVARLNNWQATPEVGDRCDIWVTFADWDIILYPKYRDNHIWVTRWPSITEYGRLQDSYEVFRLPYLFYSWMNRMPDLVVNQNAHLLSYPEAYRKKGMLIPSTGLTAIAMAIDQKMAITIAGFDCFLAEEHHYFEEKQNEIVDYHSGTFERRVISNWRRAGLLAIAPQRSAHIHSPVEWLKSLAED